MATTFDNTNRKRNQRIATKLRRRREDGIPLTTEETDWLRLYEAHRGKPGRKRAASPLDSLPKAERRATPPNMQASAPPPPTQAVPPATESPPAEGVTDDAPAEGDAPPLNIGTAENPPPIEQTDTKNGKWWSDGDFADFTTQELAELYGAMLLHFGDKLPPQYPRIPEPLVKKLIIPAAKFVLEKNMPSLDEVDPEKAAYAVVAAPAAYVGGSHLFEWWKSRKAKDKGSETDPHLKVVP